MSYISTYCDVLPQLLRKVLLYRIQHTTYFSSRGLLSGISRSVCTEVPTSHSYCIQPLESDLLELNATLSHTCWQVGIVLRSAPPVTLCLPALPFQEHKQTFFPTHLLHNYIHRSCQWMLPHGSEQACVDRLLRARVCRLSRVGHIAVLILMRLRPQNFYIISNFDMMPLVKGMKTLYFFKEHSLISQRQYSYINLYR